MNSDQFKASFSANLHRLFRTWMHAGDFPTQVVTPSPAYLTLGQFVSAHATQSPGWEAMTVRQFLATPSPEGTLRNELRTWFKGSLPWLVAIARELTDPDTVEDRDAIRATCDSFLASGEAVLFVDSLIAIFDAEMADLTLLDTFRRRPAFVGLVNWSQYNAEQLEEAEEVASVEVGTASRSLFLSLSHNDYLDAPVVATEWVGGTKARGNGQWRSVGAGMVYHFQRGARDRADCLLTAADEISSGDLERVVAFLESHGNQDAILKKGDIAFVWEWERRHDAQAGEGVECLAAICAQLRAAYPKLASIVFPLSPQRFAPHAAGEPPLITEARLSDLDKLHAYVSELGDRLGLDVYATGSDGHSASRALEVVKT